ncbi:MAG TPA: M14 family metallopeptidase [Bacteroidales bacterium]|nr:M14 family metallopeptidase [Bacteroidales bacterium]
MRLRKLQLLFYLFFILTVSFIKAQDPNWETYYEKSGFLETPRYEQTVEFCQRLADYSPVVHYTNFGVSPQGRLLPLLIVDKDGHFTPGKSSKTVLLIESGIHPGEPDGKDAVLMLIRDIVVYKKYNDLLENITILFIPVFNVDGHERFGPYNRINQNGPKEMGWRTTAQNLNLNRDFVKADAPEMQAWLKLFNEWKPHFFIDCHSTDGADYQYAITYMIETLGNMDNNLTHWLSDVYEPSVSKKMEESGFPIFPYVTFRQWHDIRSGLRTGAAPGMLSQGYCALLNRPGLLIETHMLKDYKTRVEGTYNMILFTMNILSKEGDKLKDLIDKADNYCASAEFRKEPFPLGFRISNTDSIMVDFKGVEYDISTSDLTGGSWFHYYPELPVTYSLPLFNKNIPSATTMLPEAYIIPAEWTEIIGRIKYHGITMYPVREKINIEIETYVFENPVWSIMPNEGHHTVNAEATPVIMKREFAAGSVIIPIDQPSARLIARMLEPKSNDSFLYWGFFNAIFEQKEYAETYVMEPLARKMLDNDETLRQEFEDAKQKNPDFFKQQWNILNWFYLRSDYRDHNKNVYPVGRIKDLSTLVY